MEREPAAQLAERPLVTLDNCALIALRDHEPEEEAVQELLAMNRAQRISINITLSTGLEAGRDGKRQEWSELISWLEGLGIAKSNILTSADTVAFTNPVEPGGMLFDSALERQLMERIHANLRSNVPFSWYDYRDRETRRAGVSVEAMAEYDFARMGTYIPPTPNHPRQFPTPQYDALSATEQERMQVLHRRLLRNWHNAKNDSLGLYNHVTKAVRTHHPEWSVFVTMDQHFLASTRLPALQALGFHGKILPPADAVTFLTSVIATVSA